METSGFLSSSQKPEQKSVYVTLTLLTGDWCRVSEGEWSTPPPGQVKQQGRPHEHCRERRSFKTRDKTATRRGGPLCGRDWAPSCVQTPELLGEP